MKSVRCQMCRNKTDNPQKVTFRGWNNELKFPCEISLCPRCRSIWKVDEK